MPRPSQRLLLVANPAASRVSARVVKAVHRALSDRFSVELVATSAPGDATELCRRAAGEGWASVAVLGGDGTHAEAGEGLMGTVTALAPLPGGCTSVFARSLGVARTPVQAARHLSAAGLASGRRVDVGLAAGRCFLFAAGLGVTAELMERAARRPQLKGILGQPAFGLACASLLAERRRPRLPAFRVEAGGRVVRGVSLVAQNASPLTYLGSRPVDVCAGAGSQTGTLSFTLAHRAQAGDVWGIVRRLRTGDPATMLAHPQLEGFTAVTHVRIEALDEGPFALELDGTAVGRHTAVELTVAPASLTVIG
ncbi:MAG TPA: diacylglycerol kinase family protein [Solirubrobacteraceae bacterium]|nr:diacylglycerol kinase family protein [Solirubrobacteraceae bacterium]